MVGRKRARKYREPSGRVQREPAKTKLELARQLKNRIGLSDNDVTDPKAETQFGRMALTKAITSEQFDAGERWRGVVMAYRAVIQGPNPFPKSIAGAVVGGGGGESVIDDEEAQRRKAAYNESYQAVMGKSFIQSMDGKKIVVIPLDGMTCMRTLNEATVHERFVQPHRMTFLCGALNALVGLAYEGKRRAR